MSVATTMLGQCRSAMTRIGSARIREQRRQLARQLVVELDAWRGI
jgi:hypothetical protein